ncbi:MAG: 16S rRNA (guanine(527)-N(7))-methyltransferase RsmG [Alphaproteobacteria bacterium]|nr:16S rRNA (guanine(527)-N(7))-methyltransferase RsmG [Alphaproteobacteria bacterium]
MTPEAFADAAGVSRETLPRLDAYLELLRRWNQRINLVAAATLADPWRRHLLDSAQLLPHATAARGPLGDLGSGAGFPGLVLAILGREQVTLVESDQRKCAFLREAARIADAAVTVVNARIETATPLRAAVVTARACAPLAALLGYAHRHLAPGGVALFLKGQNMVAELEDASRSWVYGVESWASLADPQGKVLRLRDIARG